MKKAIVFVLCMMLVCGFSWGKLKTYGGEVSSETTVTVEEILTEPKAYEGNDVTVEGTIIRECSSGCWLDLKGDTGVVYVDLHPSQFAIPQKVNRGARVEGTVKIRDGKPMIIAKGVEV